MAVNKSCTLCLAGQYCATSGADQPTGNCDAGYYCITGSAVPNPHGELNVLGEISGDICPEGSYCPVGSFEPTGCPAGTFSNAKGLAVASQVRLLHIFMYLMYNSA